jgi:type IV pilus assembly protein PilA
MRAFVTRRQGDRESGFTLIELLVVIIIIGILAAIAIPVFLDQRNKSYDATAKSDLKNLANFEEIYLNDYGTYGDWPSLIADEPLMEISHNDTMSITYDAQQGYCLTAQYPGTQKWFYDSEAGGLQPKSATTCPSVTGSWSPVTVQSGR